MAINSTIQFQNYIITDGHRSAAFNETLTGANLIAPNFTVAASTTISLNGTAFATANLLAYSLYSTGGPVTVKFNTTGSSVNFTVADSAVPQIWSAAHGSNPLATNCTGITVANATTATPDVSINVLLST